MKSAAQVETPKEAARRLSARAVQDGNCPQGLHEYCDAAGKPVYWRIRLKHPVTGEKWIRPMRWDGTKFVIGEPPAPTTGKILYRLPELLAADRSAPVLIVEGESCADHLHALGLIVTTSGSAASGRDADWTPLRGRHCTMWPDHDSAGRKYGEDVAAILGALSCTVDQIDVHELGLASKGDAVDWLAMHPDATQPEVLQLARRPCGSAPNLVASKQGVILTRGSDVQPVAIDWLWQGYLAAGKLHLIGGAPGGGKTTIAAALAAVVTSGGCWPDGSRADQGSVVFWSGEDTNEDTLNPRFRAAGADMSRVHTVDGMQVDGRRFPFDPARHLDALRVALKTVPDVRLIVIDPIASAVAADSHKNAEVRRGLQPLVDLAREFRSAVLGITHFSKGTGGRDPVERITGSLAFGALPRVVMVTARREAHDDRPERRLFLRAKSNIGPDGDGFEYSVQQGELDEYPGIIVSSVRWGEANQGSAREQLDDVEQSDSDDAGDVAVHFLQSVLAHGPRAVQDIKAEAATAGIAWRTVERAKRRAGVLARKNGMGGGWQWSEPTKAAQDPQFQAVAEFGGLPGNVAAVAENDATDFNEGSQIESSSSNPALAALDAIPDGSSL